MGRLKNFNAQTIIFDKDGTLIDVDAMWGGWIVYLAEQLHLVRGLEVRETLCLAMGYNDENKIVLAHGKLTATSIHMLHRLTVEVMQSLGLITGEADHTVEKGWCMPDPVISVNKFTNMRALFRQLNGFIPDFAY